MASFLASEAEGPVPSQALVKLLPIFLVAFFFAHVGISARTDDETNNPIRRKHLKLFFK
jgi:hypothetical protein